MDDEDDDVSFIGAYEGGHWVWNEEGGGLYYFVDAPFHKEEATVVVPQKLTAMGAAQFRELDLIEQMRFRKRYMRKLKPNEEDVITLQDIKDIAIYSAPTTVLSFDILNMLHIPTTEKFLRALILYCQYYLQISKEMTERVAAQETQIRTPTSEEVEETFRNNLCDLRSVVAKEYCTILIGGQDTKSFHHMGLNKKKRSLTDKDAHFFESFLLMCIQIVWLALGRRSFNQVELEINRLIKTEIFNSVEHRLKTGYIGRLSAIERKVLLGHCVRHETKLHTRSPLGNEVFCKDRRPVDYRLLGVGSIKYEYLPPRLRYVQLALTCPEQDLETVCVTVGILGKPRKFFDTALHLLPNVVADHTSGKSSHSRDSRDSTKSAGSGSSSSKRIKSQANVDKKIDPVKNYGYADIALPSKECEDEYEFPSLFPEKQAAAVRCNEVQRLRWYNRLKRILYAPLTRQSEYEHYQV